MSTIRSKAFTLVELLLATMLASLVGLALVGTFSAGMKAYQKVQSLGGGNFEVLLSLEKMEKDLRNAFVFNGVAFKADNHSVSFPGLDDYQGIEKISYSFDSGSGQFIRQEQLYPSNNAAVSQEMARLKGLTLSYGVLPPEGGNISWTSSWPDEQHTGIPKLVKIIATVKGEHEDVQINRTVFLFTALQAVR